MDNPFNIVVGGFAPVQGNGILPTGEYFYIRSRSFTSIDISETEKDWWDNKYLFNSRLEEGYLSDNDLIKWGTEQIKCFYEKR